MGDGFPRWLRSDPGYRARRRLRRGPERVPQRRQPPLSSRRRPASSSVAVSFSYSRRRVEFGTMIVREKLESYVLIKQHDHGLISGEFARRWAECPRPLGPTLYAIANHDAGWKILDASVRWNDETGKPYSFTNYPTVTKLRAYEEGLDLLEVEYPYAACLCSMHYTALVGD